MVLSHLSKTERAYLAGSKEFTAKQKRDIRYTLNKKMMKLYDKNNNSEGWAEGQDLNPQATPSLSMATDDKQQTASLDMAGVVGSNPSGFG